jgi:hypothetical protein
MDDPNPKPKPNMNNALCHVRGMKRGAQGLIHNTIKCIVACKRTKKRCIWVKHTYQNKAIVIVEDMLYLVA